METGKIGNRWQKHFTFGHIVDAQGQRGYFEIQYSPDLKGKEESLDKGTPVVFEKRPPTRNGFEFEAYNVRLPGTSSQQSKQSTRGRKQRASRSQETGKSKPPFSKTFHNPYTFVPSPPRDEIEKGEFAGDFDPLECGLDHASLKPDLWTGRIPIKLTTVTPLVLPKTDGEDRDSTQRQTYDVLDYLPESSLRGMLRSAYEVVTNSRYSSFHNKDRLAYRMAPSEANILIPTIIKEDTQTGQLKACFYTGSSHPTNNGPMKTRKLQGQPLTLEQIKEGAMYAALLPRYKKTKTTYQSSNEEPKTGDEVYVEIILCGSGSYLYWQTSRIWKKSSCKTKPNPGNVPSSWNKKKLYSHSNGKHIIEVVEGTVLITNENIDKKGNERIFFYNNPKTQQEVDLTDDHKKNWRALIQNYRDAHPNDDDIFDRKDMSGTPKKPWQVFKKNADTPEYAWSPHLYHRGKQEDRWGRKVHDALDFQDGDMAYARCNIDNNTGDIKSVKELFPVMISRELYKNSPEDLLDPSLLPAKKLDELSPADRLFGWTPQGEGSDGGYKSRIRVVYEDGARPDIIESFSDGPLPLTILGQPKPEQGRFYVAKDKEGAPQDNAPRKEGAGYSKGKGLRGRKQYWHHKGLEAEKAPDYWKASAEDRTQQQTNGRYQEYRRPDKNKQPQIDAQNRSIKGWVKPCTVFKASLYVQNLQPEEVGALLWLLTLNDEVGDEGENHYFRLGYGKSLGFGSVKMELEKGCLPLGIGEDWKKKYYTTFDASAPATLDEEQQNACLQAFKASMVDGYNPLQTEDDPAEEDDEQRASDTPQQLTSLADLEKIQIKITPENRKDLEEQHFNELPFIAAFLQVLKGPVDNAPIHYPRQDRKPTPDGKNFEWFTANERNRNSQHALPAVTDENGLPYEP